MNPVVETGAASVVTSYLVSLFKLAWPAAPTAALVAVALVAGLASTVLISLSNGAILDTQTLATNAIQGIAAAAMAAGLTRTDQRAESERVAARLNP